MIELVYNLARIHVVVALMTLLRRHSRRGRTISFIPTFNIRLHPAHEFPAAQGHLLFPGQSMRRKSPSIGQSPFRRERRVGRPGRPTVKWENGGSPLFFSTVFNFERCVYLRGYFSEIFGSRIAERHIRFPYDIFVFICELIHFFYHCWTMIFRRK